MIWWAGQPAVAQPTISLRLMGHKQKPRLSCIRKSGKVIVIYSIYPLNPKPDRAQTIGKRIHMELDLDRQRQAREYARTRRRLSFVSMGIAAVGIIFVFLSGLDTSLRDWLQPLTWQPIPGWYPWQVL